MKTSIEYDYSNLLKKQIIRTKGIILTGKGIKQHHDEQKTGLYNVYSVTKKAFDRICAEYQEIKLMN